MIKILSWNVNGLRAVMDKNFLEVVQETQADIICLQETKMQKHQAEHLMNLCGAYSIWNEALERKGYSGTVIWSRAKPEHMTTITGSTLLDREGRVTVMEFGTWVLCNIYFPNGWQLSSTDEDRLAYKLSFYDELMQYVQKIWARGKSVMIVWDFNIVHTERDIARPKENQNNIGFLPIERAKLDEVHTFGLVDAWRQQNPDAIECYSWWSYRAGARPNNVWWRIDAVYADEKMMQSIESVTYMTQTMWSDHCPMLTVLKQEETIIDNSEDEPTTLFATE